MYIQKIFLTWQGSSGGKADFSSNPISSLPWDVVQLAHFLLKLLKICSLPMAITGSPILVRTKCSNVYKVADALHMLS